MKYLLIILSFFLIGCLSEEDGNTATSSTSVKINISGNDSLVLVKPSTIPTAALSYSSQSFVSAPEDCLTAGDIGTGVFESIVETPGVCIKRLEKIDDSGGYVVWSMDTSNDTEVCGIINADGNVWETAFCPKSAGFKNSKALTRVGVNKLRGLSESGKYIEYDQSTDTATVIIEDSEPIDFIYELQHANKKQYMYRVGFTVKQSVDGIASIVPQLYRKQFHTIGDVLHILDSSRFYRGYFDLDANVVQYPSGIAYYKSSPVPVALTEWVSAGVGRPPPRGPSILGPLFRCETNTLESTTVLDCIDTVLKYTDSKADLIEINRCLLGNCGNYESVSCSTAEHYFYYTPFKNIVTGTYHAFRLTRMDIVNETSSNIYDIFDPSADMSTEQVANYHIQSIACSADTVTAMTATRTILINNADTTPVVNYLDITVEEVID